MKLKVIVLPLLLMMSGANAQSTVGVLGTPPDGSTVSGVSTISGYHCTSHNIEVFIDGVSYGPAGAGTQILGTQGVCGRTDTGYSFLYNFSNLPNGQHTVSVTADGVPFGTNTVTTVKSGGEQFLTGVNKQTKVQDFPHPGQAATLQWVQSYQNFLVTGIGIGDATTDLSSLNGTYVQNSSISVSGGSCYQYGFLTGTQELLITAGVSAANPNVMAVYVIPTSTFSDLCLLSLTKASGDSANGFNLNGSVGCVSSTDTPPAVATGLRRADDGLRLLGTITGYLLGCTHTTVLY